MKYDLLVFDLDGTLVDTREDLAAAVNAMRRFYNLAELDLATICSFVGDGAPTLCARSLADSAIDPKEGLKVLLQHYRENLCVLSKIYPGCLGFLQEMKSRKVKMAVLTNKPLEMTLELLRELKLEHFFSPILSPENAECTKPEPGGMYKCFAENGSCAEKTLMIGDHHTDLRVAINSGVDNAFFTQGMGHKDGIDCTYTFDDYNCLAALLDS